MLFCGVTFSSNDINFASNSLTLAPVTVRNSRLLPRSPIGLSFSLVPMNQDCGMAMALVCNWDGQTPQTNQSQQCPKPDNGRSVLDHIPSVDLPSLPQGVVDFFLLL